MLFWMHLELLEKFTQHNLSNSAQSCPCASKRKQISALFCRVACLTLLMSVSISLIARDVALVSLLSQHPTWSNCFNAIAEEVGVKTNLLNSFHSIPGSKNHYYNSLHIDWKIFFLCFFLMTALGLGAITMSSPVLNGPPPRHDGIPC